MKWIFRQSDEKLFIKYRNKKIRRHCYFRFGSGSGRYGYDSMDEGEKADLYACAC